MCQNCFTQWACACETFKETKYCENATVVNGIKQRCANAKKAMFDADESVDCRRPSCHKDIQAQGAKLKENKKTLKAHQKLLMEISGENKNGWTCCVCGQTSIKGQHTSDRALEEGEDAVCCLHKVTPCLDCKLTVDDAEPVGIADALAKVNIKDPEKDPFAICIETETPLIVLGDDVKESDSKSDKDSKDDTPAPLTLSKIETPPSARGASSGSF